MATRTVESILRLTEQVLNRWLDVEYDTEDENYEAISRLSEDTREVLSLISD